MNTDENSAAMQYGIKSIPTMLLFRNSIVVDQILGAVSKQMIKGKLNYFAHDLNTVLN